MGRRSWVHIITSKEKYEKIEGYIKNNDLIYIVGAAVLEGEIQTNCPLHSFGIDKKKSLLLLTESDGSFPIEDMINNNIIQDYSEVALLDNISPEDIEYTNKGAKLIKARYLTKEEFQELLNTFENIEDFYNDKYIKFLEEQSSGVFILYNLSYLINNIISRNSNYYGNLNVLLNLLESLFNKLGFWSFHKEFPSNIVIESIQRIFEYIQSNENKIPFDIIKYFTDLSKELRDILSMRVKQEENFTNNFLLNQRKQDFRFTLWLYGGFITQIINYYHQTKEPVPLEPFIALNKVFKHLAEFIFASTKIEILEISIKTLENEIERTNNGVYNNLFNDLREVNKLSLSVFDDYKRIQYI
ncbi:MAG: hypothetical protein ACTSRH_05020 [Promethearchaeota archaeon]